MKIFKLEYNQNQDLTTRKVGVLGRIFFQSFSEGEEKIMTALIKYSDGSLINITPAMTKILADETGIGENVINVTLSRLSKKGSIRKDKRVITIHPAFNNIQNENEFLIRFVYQ